ncbi:MAG: transcription antitermination factor NusB [Chloroflexota bacterium]
MASTRRAAREAAIKTLYQVDVGGMEVNAAFAAAADMEGLDGEALDFARALSLGTTEHRATVDARIGQLSHAWTVSRLAAVDRAILRLAAYEILYRPDIPVSASINEAVELAKIYSTPESGRFVNGVLGALARAARSAEAPRPEPEQPGNADRGDAGEPSEDDFSTPK